MESGDRGTAVDLDDTKRWRGMREGAGLLWDPHPEANLVQKMWPGVQGLGVGRRRAGGTS